MPKFCKDCKYFNSGEYGKYKGFCTHKSALIVDVVWGITRYVPAKHMREDDDCGPDGNLYEARM